MVSVTVATGMGLLTSAGRFAPYAKTIERLAGAVMILAGLGQLSLALVVYQRGHGRRRATASRTRTKLRHRRRSTED